MATTSEGLERWEGAYLLSGNSYILGLGPRCHLQGQIWPLLFAIFNFTIMLKNWDHRAHCAEHYTNTWKRAIYQRVCNLIKHAPQKVRGAQMNGCAEDMQQTRCWAKVNTQGSWLSVFVNFSEPLYISLILSEKQTNKEINTHTANTVSSHLDIVLDNQL